MANIWTILPPWVTPATVLQPAESGDCRIVKTTVSPGMYQLATRDTHYFLPEPLPVTSIEVRGDDGNWHSLMTDEPRHWYGMLELAFRAHGSVVVGGLGLGLIQWALLLNPAVTSILTIERLQDVVALHAEQPVIVGDVFEELRKLYGSGAAFDTIITDIAPTDIRHPDHGRIFAETQALERLYPKALHLHHGFQKYFDLQRYLRTATNTDCDWLNL